MIVFYKQPTICAPQLILWIAVDGLWFSDTFSANFQILFSLKVAPQLILWVAVDSSWQNYNFQLEWKVMHHNSFYELLLIGWD